MPIPPLDENGYLPEGIYDCTLAEVEERFAKFQRSERRIRLFEKLREYMKQLTLTNMGIALFIGGSFVTAKPEPEDMDLILVLKEDHDYQATLRPFEYNAITKPGVKRQYRFDLFAFAEGTDDLQRQLRFFQRERGSPERRKGILRIQL